MAAKIKWHRYGTKLRRCHPIYSCSGSYKLTAAELQIAAVHQGLPESSLVQSVRNERNLNVNGILRSASTRECDFIGVAVEKNR